MITEAATKHTFKPAHAKVGQLDEFTQRQIMDEPMLFHASEGFAETAGGPITRAFLAHLWFEGSGDYVIDSRVHMLMPGWFPCIPGWHIDGLRRPNGQPNFRELPKGDEHFLAVVGPTSHTEWLDRAVILNEPDPDAVYESWSHEIERIIRRGDAETVRYESGAVVRFGPTDFHRGVPADRHAWRFFIRASRAEMEVKNEIRKQVQIYIGDEHAGW